MSLAWVVKSATCNNFSFRHPIILFLPSWRAWTESMAAFLDWSALLRIVEAFNALFSAFFIFAFASAICWSRANISSLDIRMASLILSNVRTESPYEPSWVVFSSWASARFSFSASRRPSSTASWSSASWSSSTAVSALCMAICRALPPRTCAEIASWHLWRAVSLLCIFTSSSLSSDLRRSSMPRWALEKSEERMLGATVFTYLIWYSKSVFIRGMPLYGSR